MAGIGFGLRKLFSKNDAFSTLKGCVYSVIISSGPWLITICTIAYVNSRTSVQLDFKENILLKSILNYSFGISLVFFGLIEMPVTRYLADKLYLNDLSSYRSLYAFLVMAFSVFGSALSYLFYYNLPYSWFFKISCSLLFISIFSVWVAMVFLSAAKKFTQVVLSFVAGGIATGGLGVYLGEKYGLGGFVLGLALGQALLAVFLGSRVAIEFSSSDSFSFEFLDYFRKYKLLIFVGFGYYFGIFIDKWVFWSSAQAVHVSALLYTNPFYETSMFLAYLTIVPSFAFFMVRVETEFFSAYQYYFTLIDQRADLHLIEESINEMIVALKKAILPLLEMQTLISVLVLYFANDILGSLQLSGMYVPMFKYGVIGAYLQVLFLFCNIILLYFEYHFEVFLNYLVFVVTNLLFSIVTLKMGFQYHGLGFVFSTLITFIVSALTLNRRLSEINFRTFMGQKLVKENLAESLE